MNYLHSCIMLNKILSSEILSSEFYQYCEKILGTSASKSLFSVKFGVVWQRCQVCYPIGIVDDFRII